MDKSVDRNGAGIKGEFRGYRAIRGPFVSASLNSRRLPQK